MEDVEDGGMDDGSEVKMMVMVEMGNVSTHKWSLRRTRLEEVDSWYI